MVETKDQDTLLASMRSRVQEQGDIVRALKSRNAPDSELKVALAELKARKKLLEEKEAELIPMAPNFDRGKLEDLLKQKFFYDQSFAIYGGVQGLYDYGPMGCAMKSNLIAFWRQHFILEDQLLEVDCSMLTPAPVLQASGHVERFTDLMVKDVKTGECFRADHLVKANLEAKLKHKKTTESEKQEIQKLLSQLDNFGSKELDEIIRRYEMKAPTTNNELTEPQEFNLMFSTMIGPTGQCKSYLRPETAQGIFVNFQRLLQFNQGRIPFGAAQIGSAFRNEISPRSGLIRVREFAMAEIEYFVDPKHKEHPKFESVRDFPMMLYSACDQMDGRSPRLMTIGEAVDQGIVANETLGYFLARICKFLLMIGLDPARLRFRQHLSNEMAHYACDCWDAECQTSYGWVECVGCADRSCYDLTQHARATGTRLVAEKQLPEPRMVHVCECVPNKQALGKTYRAEAKALADRLAALTLDEALQVKQDLQSSGEAKVVVGEKPYVVDKNMVQIKEYDSKVHVEEIVPNVIEPSFGLGRILYAVFEHSFRVREGDEQRTYLSVPPLLAPYKCSVLPLSSHPDFAPFVRQLSEALTRTGVSHRIDESSGSIGRRYARTDQLAIPYGITVDFDTVNKSPASATLRERDSMKQIRVPLDQLPSLVRDLSDGVLHWDAAQAQYPAFEQQETVQRDDNKAIPSHQLDSKISPPAVSQHVTAEHAAAVAAPPAAAAPVDEWQSVSEDPELLDKKPECEPEVDPWSSATEEPAAVPSTTEANKKTSPIPDQPVREFHQRAHEHKAGKSGTKRGHKHNHTRKSEKPDASPAKEAADEPRANEHTSGTVSGSGTLPKLPSCWADCAKAIRKHYQEEESREKKVEQMRGTQSNTAPNTNLLDLEESRNSYSGYEADQEDNVVNKSSTLGQLSPMTGISPEVPDEMDLGPSTPPAPVGPGPELPNHGLFVGEGWPGQKTAGSKGVKNQHPELESANVTPSTGWEATMAQVYEKTCEPDMWQAQLNQADPLPRITPVPYDPSSHPPVQLPTTETKDEPGMGLATHTAEVDSSSRNHGLFVGSGWPMTKQEKESLKEKQKHEANRDATIEAVPENKERPVDPQQSATITNPPNEESSNIEFDDPLFGDMDAMLPEDTGEPDAENTITFVHTEPAPEPVSDATGAVPPKMDAPKTSTSAILTPDDHKVEDRSVFEHRAQVDTPKEPQIKEKQSSKPVSLDQAQRKSGDDKGDERKSTESPLPSVQTEKPASPSAEKPDSHETQAHAAGVHEENETGTLKSKSKRRKHKKKKTQS